MYLSQKNLILSGKFFFDFQMGYPFSSHTPNDLFFEPPSLPLPPCTRMCAFREPPFCVRDFINWIPSALLFDFTRLSQFPYNDFLRNFIRLTSSSLYAFLSQTLTNSHLTSHAVPGNLSQKDFSLMVVLNC